MKRVVAAVGGSILVPTLESHRLREWSQSLIRLSSQGIQLFVVVGGGGEARRYISVCHDLKFDEASSDEIGIMVTKINAMLLIHALGEYAYPRIAESYIQAKEFAVSGKIVVMGGVTPGQTTDAVSSILAEEIQADLQLNLTAVDGIYSADPRKDASATKYASLSPDALISLIMKEKMNAGSNIIIDMVAAKITERSGIPMLILDGRSPKIMEDALINGVFNGTFVGTRNVTLPL